LKTDCSFVALRNQYTTRTMVPFVLLTQILPVSFAVSLFVIQLHLSALGTSPSPNSPPPTKPAPRKFKPTTATFPTILLNAALLTLPSLRNRNSFVPLVLFSRLLLVLPFTGRIGLSDKQVVQSIYISGGFVVAYLAAVRKAVGWRDVLTGLGMVEGKEAVRALGWDGLFGAVVWMVLAWGGGV
jgi:hypothetical protein